MDDMKRWLLACLVALPAVRLLAQAPAPSLASIPVDVLLARAADYVDRFERSISTAVVEERYVQIIKRFSGPPKEPDRGHLAWADDISAVRPDVIVKQRRQTKSDVLLVQLPNQIWTAFRDTFEVNGGLRRNRDERLRNLFLDQNEDSQRQLRRINETSAEWNLGQFYRDINLPTTGLFLLHARNQQRLAFRAGDVDDSGATACRIVTFKESARPTVVKSRRGYDVPLSGRACIDAAGAVVNTRLDLDGRYTMRGAIDVTYERHERLEVLAPGRMWEWYALPESGAETDWPMYVEGMATYSNLRLFTVTSKVK
jgi:hypothetical protein